MLGRPITVIGVSSGLGVSLFPFQGSVVANIEQRGIFHTPKNEQWELNFPNVPLIKELSDLYPEITADAIISSPDCGSGSILRMSRAKVWGDHKQNKSLLRFFQSTNIYNPKFFLFENLDGLFRSFSEEEFRKELPNYRLVIHIASVAHFGNSQKNRKRLIIVGIRKDLPEKLDKFFKLPRYKEPKTCKELYGDLSKVIDAEFGQIREKLSESVSIHARRRITFGEIRNEWMNRLYGKKRWSVENESFSSAPGVYRNLKGSFPATVRKFNRQFDHNGLTLTPRQVARIQGVPDTFKIYINPNKLNHSINKARAVLTKSPPYEISEWFKGRLQRCMGLWANP